MSDTLKLALIQHPNQGSATANLDFIESQIKVAAEAGARLILLQELHNGAYFCSRQDPSQFALAETIPGPSTERLGRVAAQYAVVVVASLFERRAAGVYHNTAVVLEKDGSVAGRYRKMHIPEDPGYHEKFYFTPGDDGFEPVDTSLGRLGVLVCWDQWYPEAARLMAMAGAELLLYPTAIGWDPDDPAEEQERQLGAWQIVQRGHAVANGLPVAVCNRTGHEVDPVHGGAGQVFWGSSFVAGPQGEMLAEAPSDQAHTLIVDVDMGRSETVRRIWPFLRDRRIDAYGDLTRRMRR